MSRLWFRKWLDRRSVILSRRACPSRSRWKRLHIEPLEERVVLSLQPVSLADPSFYGDSGNGASGDAASGQLVAQLKQFSFSDDGQIVAFTSEASNLVPNTKDFTGNIYVNNLATHTMALASINAQGTGGGNQRSYDPVLTPDGRFVIFHSEATNLVTGVTSSQWVNIYERDLVTGFTKLVSVNRSGNADSGNNLYFSVSSDGRFVAFESSANDLVDGFTIGPHQNIYIRDMVAGTTRLVSVNRTGAADGNANSSLPVISANGRFVAFASDASDLVANDNNSSTDIFVRDLQTGTTTLVSVNRFGTGSGDGASPAYFDLRPQVAISPDGRYVAFVSEADDLVAGKAKARGSYDVYLRDVQSSTTVLVSDSLAGNGGANAFFNGLDPVISADGRYVAFASEAHNLVASPTYSQDIYLRDAQTGATRLISVATNGNGGNRDSSGPSVSADGRYVAFQSDASNLVNNDNNQATDVFVRDAQAGTTTLVSVNRFGTGSGNGSSAVHGLYDGQNFPVFDPAGDKVLFASYANDLVANDNNRAADVFVRDWRAGVTTLVSRRSDALPAAFTAHGSSNHPSVSADGRYVAFESRAPDLVANNAAANAGQVYVRDVQTGTMTLVSVNTMGVGGNGDSTHATISGDGRFVVFLSDATDLVPGAPSGYQVYIRDLQLRTTTLVSLNAAGNGPGNGFSSDPVVSADGRLVAFLSTATNLVPGYVRGNQDPIYGDLFVRDMQRGVTTLASINRTGTAGANSDVETPELTPNGRLLVFASSATDLTSNDTRGGVFLRDLQAGTTTLVSVNASGTASGNYGSSGYIDSPSVVSADGRFVVFDSESTDLVSGLIIRYGSSNVFIRDLQLGRTSLVSINSAGTGSGNVGGHGVTISADGRYVTFESYSSDLVPEGTTKYPNEFVRDLQTGRTSLVSVNIHGQDSGSTGGSIISADGNFVAFFSRATDLVPGFSNSGNPVSNIYLRDLQKGTTALVSINVSGNGGGDGDSPVGLGSPTYGMAITPNGRTVAFSSDASNLFLGDHNGATDVFLYQSGSGSGSIHGQVFADLNGNGTKDPGEPGLAGWTVFLDLNGNGRLDPGEPSVVTDSAGNYAFTSLAAGTYTVAQVVPSHNVRTLPADPGTYSVTLTTGTETVTGRDFGDKPQFPNLVVSSIIAPATGSAGQTITASWTIRNQGTDVAPGGWQDALYLSTSQTLTPDSPLLGVVTHAGNLAVGAQYTGSLNVAIPGLHAGNYYLIVVIDRRRQVDEGAFPRNTQGVSPNPIALTLPMIVPGQPVFDRFTAPNQEHYYQISVPAGKTLILSLTSSASTGTNELFIRPGDLPTPYDFQVRGIVPGQPNQFVIVPTTQGATYYVLAQNREGAAGMAGYTLLATLPSLAIQSVAPNSGGNTGRVTLTIQGTQLTSRTQVSLVAGGTTIVPVTTDFRDASLLYATFDLTGKPAGSYGLRATDNGQTVTSPQAFHVVAGVTNPLRINLTTPSFIDSGREGTLVVDYENIGNTDIMAPLLELTSDKSTLRLPELQGDVGNTIQFLGISPSGPPGILPPGAKGTVVLNFTSTTNVRHDEIHFNVQVADDTQAINWANMKAELRPSYIPADAWEAVFANLVANLGGTVASYHAALVNDADYLGRLGETTDDVSRLFAFEIQKANAFYTGQSLASSVDASLPTPGLGLTFQRQFLQPVGGRYQLGSLGRGWTSNWDINASTDNQGNVTIYEGGSIRFFARQANGSFQASVADHGTLTTLASGVYQLRELDGTLLVFNLNGTLNYEQDTNGNRITAAYTNGLLASLTHSNGASLTFSYNAQSRLIQVQDSAGPISTYGYDPSGQHLLTYTDKYGTTTYTYVTGQGAARQNALASIAFSDNTHVFFSFDAVGRLVNQHRDNNQEGLTVAYLSPGGFTITDANGATTSVLPDDFGQVGETIDPLGQMTQYRYDASMNLTQVLGPFGSRYVYTYDSLGDVTSTTDPLGLTVHFTYDTSGHLLGYQDARGNSTGYRYDSNGNLLAIAYPSGSLEQFSYDPMGDPIQMINGRGHAIKYTYNNAGQVTRTDFVDGTHQDYTYDTHGNLRTASDASGTITLSYDDSHNPDLVTKITYPDGKFLQFNYNSVGQRTKSVDQTGFTINYQYNALGRLQKLTDGTGALFVSYTYDPAGRLIRKDMGNGTATTYQYDLAGNLLHLVNLTPNGAVNSRFDYTYDALGRVLTEASLDGQWTYTYDADGQLIHAVFASNNPVVLPNKDLQYAYDAAGNRTQATINGMTTTYVANSLNEYASTTTAGVTTAYQFDTDGNLISMTDSNGTTTYAFNDENQLTGVNGPGLTIAYTYDPLGNRNRETANGQTTYDLIDPLGLSNVMSQYNGASTLVAHYVVGLGLTSRVDGSGKAAYYDFDASGNTVGLTDLVGNYVNRYSYLPFGTINTVATAVPNPFTFIGEFGVKNDGNGTFEMKFRQYDAETGQFFSKDPMGLEGGDVNLRRYVGNQPLTQVDPQGLCVQTTTDLGYAWYIYDPSEDLPNGAPAYSLLKPGWDAATNYNITVFRAGNQAYLNGKIDPGEIAHEQQHVDDNQKYGAAKNPEEELIREQRAYRVGYQHAIDPRIRRAQYQGYCDAVNHNGSRILGPMGTSPTQGPGGMTQNLVSGDPNELIGPAGFGDGNWLLPQQVLPYTIEFENDPKIATAPAQEIFITEKLDPNLDWSTFELGEIGFGATRVQVPAGLQSFHTSVSTTNADGTPLRVDIDANLDLTTGIVTWTLRSIDPATGLLPTDPFAGLLPVDDDSHRGEGYVRYLVRPKAHATSGTRISAQASIVFDVNAPIATNTVSNSLDNAPPSSAIAALPALTTAASFTVTWAGSDSSGPGLASFDIYVSDNGRPFTLWLAATTQTSATYAGVFGHAYGFYSVATDNLGNRQPTPAGAQATTTLAAANQIVPHSATFFVIAGAPGRVQVRKVGDGSLLADFAPYGPSYTGGVSVAVGDINGDGFPDLVTGATTGNPHIKVYNGKAFTDGTFNPANPDASLLTQFFAYGLNLDIGANVAVGDVSGNGFADIVTGATAGNPHVKVFSGKAIAASTFNSAHPDASLVTQFFAYGLQFNIGVHVAVGDVSHDGFADIVTGATAGNPQVKVYDGKAIASGTFDPAQPDANLLAQWFAFGLQLNLGVNVAVGDVNGDGYADIITGATAGNPQVKVYDGQVVANHTLASNAPDGSLLDEFYAYELGAGLGVTVGTADFEGTGRSDILTGASGGAPHFRIVRGNATGVQPAALFEVIPSDFRGGITVGG